MPIQIQKNVLVQIKLRSNSVDLADKSDMFTRLAQWFVIIFINEESIVAEIAAAFLL